MTAQIIPVDPDNARALARHAAEIRHLGKRVVSDVIEIGRLLVEAKELVGHGDWLPWLSREFQWTGRTAERFMQVHRLSLKNDNLSNLAIPLTGLYLLAAPSTPEVAKQEVISRAEAGEPIPLNTVKEIVGRAKHGDRRGEPDDGHDLDGCGAPDDDAGLEARWRYNFSNMAKLSMELPDHWNKRFENWTSFTITRHEIDLAEKAASAWVSIAKTLKEMCNRGAENQHPREEAAAAFLIANIDNDKIPTLIGLMEGTGVEDIIVALQRMLAEATAPTDQSRDGSPTTMRKALLAWFREHMPDTPDIRVKAFHSETGPRVEISWGFCEGQCELHLTEPIVEKALAECERAAGDDTKYSYYAYQRRPRSRITKVGDEVVRTMKWPIR